MRFHIKYTISKQGEIIMKSEYDVTLREMEVRTVEQRLTVSRDYPVWAHDYRTYTALPIPAGAIVTIVATGTWNIYADPRRLCNAAGSGVTAHNGGEHGDWPISGITEGCMLIWFNDQVHYYPWQATQYPNVVVTQFVSPGGNLGFGPNDNFIQDNQDSISVRVQWN
jgi:hypothetical protein